jgi:hypothetical protein
MDLKNLELILESDSVPKINKIGYSYDILNDVNEVKKSITKKYCGHYGVKILESDEEIIEHVLTEKIGSENQNKLVFILSKHKIVSTPIVEEKNEDNQKSEDIKWIGVDLDGTLAKHDDNDQYSPDKIGDPIEKMINRVKKWISDGKTVKIMTARADKNDANHKIAKKAIDDWCDKHIGKKLEITNQKDKNMEELWDDKAIQINKNTGERSDGKD